MLREDIKGQNTPVRQKRVHSPTKLTEGSMMDEKLNEDWDDEDWDEDAERAISNTFAGKVHAEAALMYFITTLKV